MERFNKFSAWYKATLTGVTSVGAIFIQQYLATLNVAKYIQFLTIAIVAVIFVQIMHSAAEILVNNWRPIRRFLLGRAYLEGFWVDISFDPEEKAVLYGAFSRIYYKDGQVMSDDETFDANGEFRGSFEIKSFEYTENSLKYGFKGLTRVLSNKDLQFGYGEMQFGVRRGVPQRYAGFYFDSIARKMIFFEGEKLSPQIAEGITMNTNEGREFLRNYIKSFAQRKTYTLVDSALVSHE